MNRKTCQYHDFNHKPDYISLRKQENYIKRQIKKENAKKYQRTGWGKFSQVVKQTGCFKQAKTGKTTPKP